MTMDVIRRGPGIWKFNVDLINDVDCVKEIRTLFEEFFGFVLIPNVNVVQLCIKDNVS